MDHFIACHQCNVYNFTYLNYLPLAAHYNFIVGFLHERPVGVGINTRPLRPISSTSRKPYNRERPSNIEKALGLREALHMMGLTRLDFPVDAVLSPGC